MISWAARLNKKFDEFKTRDGLTMRGLADKSGVPYDTVNKCLRGEVENPRGDTMKKLAKALGTTEVYLRSGLESEVTHSSGASQNNKSVAGRDKSRLTFASGNGGTEELYLNLTERVDVIGTVQAGTWMEAYQLPEGEWTYMSLPVDTRYPGVTRYGLKNKGPSMSRVCKDGGTWVFARFLDLTNRGPRHDDYVIVERIRKDGMVEATAKRFRLDGQGRPWLWPESDDPEHQTPLPLMGGADIEEIRVIGLVTDIVNRV